MFGRAVLDALAPHFPAFEFHFLTHQFYDIALGNAKVKFDSVESSAIFPSHFDNAIDFSVGEVVFLLNIHEG